MSAVPAGGTHTHHAQQVGGAVRRAGQRALVANGAHHQRARRRHLRQLVLKRSVRDVGPAHRQRDDVQRLRQPVVQRVQQPAGVAALRRREHAEGVHGGVRRHPRAAWQAARHDGRHKRAVPHHVIHHALRRPVGALHDAPERRVPRPQPRVQHAHPHTGTLSSYLPHPIRRRHIHSHRGASVW